MWDNLNDPPYSSFRNSAKLAKPEKGTLEWLLCNDDGQGLPLQDAGKYLRADDYISWRDFGTDERLLVTAAPGQGKSVLSNFVLSDLESRPRDRCKVIYYFCNIRNEEATRNANSILWALIVQLCESRRRLFEILPNKYTDDYRQFFSAPLDTLLQTFQSMLRCDPLTRVYCVIDGLDVYKEGMQDLITGLSNIFNIGNGAQSSSFRLLCTTRPDPDTQHTWGGARSKILRCNPKDIEIFLNSRVDSLRPSFKQFRQLILDELQSKSEKTFLWIDVVTRKIDSLRHPSMKRVQETIARSSQDLYELYRELLESVIDQDGISARILTWILYAKRPLQLRELEDAIALNPTAISTGISTSYRDWRKEKPSLDDIYLDLGILLDIVDDKVYFIHQSVKDFLEEQNPLENAFHDVKPRLFPAYVSMAYLALEGMGHQLRNTKKLVKEYPLLEYTARYWYDHIESTADVYSQAPLQGFLRKLVDPASGNTQLWMMVAEPWRMHYTDIRSRSHIAIAFDIGWLAELLLDRKIEDLPSDFEEYGLEGVEKAKSVSLVVIGHENSKGLIWPRAVVREIAGSHDHVMMKALLEERGDDIQITPEVVVAAAGNLESGEGVMEILLEKRGGDIQITPEVVVTAAENWTSGEGVMKILLEKYRGNIQFTPEVVVAAARNLESGEGVMKILLEKRGGDIQITPEVVVAAAENWKSGEGVMKIFLEKYGGDIQITPEVVVAAARNLESGEGVMKILLEKRGGDIQITPEVVVAAAENWKSGEGVMKILLEKRGGDIQITPEVVVAAARNRGSGERVMKMLLEKRGGSSSSSGEWRKWRGSDGDSS